MHSLHITILFWIVTLELFAILNHADGQKQLIEFEDYIGRYHLTYPSDWKLTYNNNYDLTLMPVDNKSGVSNTLLQISSMPQYNMSLEKHVLRNVNSYIDKYSTGEFVLFTIKNLSDNVDIDGFPAYLVEYAATTNDKFQSPIFVLEYFVIHNDDLFKIKFNQGGYGINSLNKIVVDNIIRSIDFRG